MVSRKKTLMMNNYSEFQLLQQILMGILSQDLGKGSLWFSIHLGTDCTLDKLLSQRHLQLQPKYSPLTSGAYERPNSHTSSDDSTPIHYIVHMHKIVSLSKVDGPPLWSRCALQKNTGFISIILRVISDTIKWHFSPHSRLTTLDCQSCISFLVNSIQNSVYVLETLDNSGIVFYILLQENTVSIYIIHTHIYIRHTHTHTHIYIYTYVYRVFMYVQAGTYKIM